MTIRHGRVSRRGVDKPDATQENEDSAGGLEDAAVRMPMTAIVIRMQTAERVEVQKALRVVTRPWSLMKPMMSGMLARRQGLSRMLRMPHTTPAPSRARWSWELSRANRVMRTSSALS
jgi:hypothetical protein